MKMVLVEMVTETEDTAFRLDHLEKGMSWNSCLFLFYFFFVFLAFVIVF